MTTRLATVTPRVLAAALVLGVLLAGGGPCPARAQDTSRTFNAPSDRVFTMTRSALKSLGRDIDKEDRDVGWIRTDSRRLDGDNFGVYAKGDRSAEKRILDEIGRSF